jgi:heavy metal sensor kinase
MTLTTRLTLFFLGTLACVLVGFSVALYTLARHHLHGQAGERLAAALNMLVAACEVGPDGVEWEPNEHSLGAHAMPRDGAVWVVTDGRENVVARSHPEITPDLLPGGRDNWRIGRRAVIIDAGAGQIPPTDRKEGQKDDKYPALFLSVAVPLAPIHATLDRLAAALVGVSAGVLLLALFAARAVCRRALRPVQAMATAAREIDTSDLSRRLEVPPARDELTELGTAFNDLIDRVQEAFERQKGFTAEASHQLRTPLTAILGQAEVALRRDRSPDEYRHALAAVHARADHLRRIVEALLFLARADADARTPGLELVELGAWLEGHLAGWADHSRRRDICFERNGAEFVVNAEPVLLGEAVDILIDNACKYSDPGAPIVIRARSEGGAAMVEVEDRGTGIAPDDLPHLFRPFFRSAAARSRGVGGVGLGLAIAQRLAAALGGSVGVASELGRGSSFSLQLLQSAHSLQFTTATADS